ncbi:MAG: hypothetical protein P1P87_05185 [Trueperaceae bacterium]|nr:hypothetical protein [Trueperaceae bacterium]
MSDAVRLASIVEGDGEVEALPVLIRAWFPQVVLLKPIRVSRDRFIRDAEDQLRYVRLARRLGATRLLVLLDAHEDCAVELASTLSPRIAAEFVDPVAVIFAVREYATWFLQCLPEFAEERSRQDLESVRGAKERIRAVRGRYTPTADQAGLTKRLADTTTLGDAVELPKSLAKLQRDLKHMLDHAG